MQAGPGVLLITVEPQQCSDEADAESYLMGQQFVTGALEGFVTYGIFGVKTVTPRSDEGPNNKAAFEVGLVQPTDSELLPNISLSNNVSAPMTELDHLNDPAAFSPPSLQFSHLMPFYILLDGLGHILQLGEGLKECLDGAAQIGSHISAYFKVQCLQHNVTVCE